jgi:peroxiredoxin
MDSKAKTAPAAPEKEEAKPNATIAHFVFVGLAALMVYGFVAMAKEGELRRRCAPTCLLKPEYAGIERTAPNFTLSDANGKSVSLADYRGKVVVLNFWTKTCGPCMEEMPDLAELHRALQTKPDVVFLTVSTDEGPNDVRATLRAVLREEPQFPILFDPDLKVVKEKYGTTLFPETWIIDKDGIVRARFDGPRDWTGGLVAEYIEQVRRGGYCPIEIKGPTKRDRQGVGAGVCDSLGGS